MNNGIYVLTVAMREPCIAITSMSAFSKCLLTVREDGC